MKGVRLKSGERKTAAVAPKGEKDKKGPRTGKKRIQSEEA